MEVKKSREDLVFWDVLVIEKHRVSLENFYGDEILYSAWRRPLCGWQIDPNTFHVSLAQAYHHKACKQKEHDVDQWNDLNAGAFVRNWRRDSHTDGVSTMPPS